MATKYQERMIRLDHLAVGNLALVEGMQTVPNLLTCGEIV